MMKKSALFLAMSSALAAPAFAAEFEVNKDTKFQINVEVAGYQVDLKNKDGVSTKEFSGKGLNQIEIKADHKVSGELTVFGEIEIDYDPIGDNGSVLTDDVRLGISSKSMGRFSFGQFDSFFEDNVAEVLAVHHGENGTLTEPASGNDGRRIQWVKPFGGLTLAVDIGRSSDAAKIKSDTAVGITGVFKTGNLTLGLGHTKINAWSSDKFEASKVDATTAASAQYKIGDLTLLGLVAKQDNLPSGKTDIMGAGLKYKMGAFDVGFAAQNMDETGKTKRTEYTMGVGYTPFKNMTVFLDMRKLDKSKGEGDAIELGMKYAF